MKTDNNNVGDPLIPKAFHIYYCEGFTEDIFNALFKWAANHSEGRIRGYNDTYKYFSKTLGLSWRFNFRKKAKPNDSGYGIDNHSWHTDITVNKYSLEQVIKLINYKTNETSKTSNEESKNFNATIGRRSTTGESTISFGRRGNGLETCNRERSKRSIKIGQGQRPKGQGLHTRRRTTRFVEL